MKYRFLFLFIFMANLAMAQQWDSLNFILPTDTLLQKSIQKADSITLSFQSKADSLNLLYQKQFNKINSTRNHLQSKIDSLNNLNLPAEKLTRKLDSLNREKEEKINSLTRKVNDLRARSIQGLKEIQLPPQLQEPMQRLQSAVDGYSLPSLNPSYSGMPSVSMPDLGSTQLLTLSSQLNMTSGLGNIHELAARQATMRTMHKTW